MTDDEYRAVCAAIEDLFKGDLDEDKRETWRMVLDRFTPTVLLGAAVELVEAGQVFLPYPGELVAAARRLTEPPLPTWAEVWTAIERAMAVSAKFRDGDPERAGVEWLEANSHELVARFYAVESYARLSRTEFYCPDYGQLRLRELEVRWERFLGSSQESLRGARAVAVVTRTMDGPVPLAEHVLVPRRQIQA